MEQILYITVSSWLSENSPLKFNISNHMKVFYKKGDLEN